MPEISDFHGSDDTRSVPLLSIIVVSYNTRDMTIACLRSVLAETFEIDYELIVLDNYSTDGSADAIRAEFPDLQLIASERNVGFALANNIAAKRARGQFILLLNPDTLVLNKGIDRLVDFAGQRPEAGIWGGRTIFEDGSLNPTSCWQEMSLWALLCRALGLTGFFPNSRLFNPEAYGGWARDSIREVDIVTGCFLLIKRELWSQLGGFDPQFFMYGEEADLCMRARKLGARPIVTPVAEIIHHGGASETVQADKMVRLLNGKISLIKRHWSKLAGSLGVLLFLAWPLTRAISFQILSSFCGRGELKERAELWSEVWQRRDQWRYGYF